jgi:hypothetical protein
MTVIDKIGIYVVLGLAAIAVLSFAAIVTATVLVTCAVRLEERYKTLSGPPPTWYCALARRLLGVPDLAVSARRPANRAASRAVQLHRSEPAALDPGRSATDWPADPDEWLAAYLDRAAAKDPN